MNSPAQSKINWTAAIMAIIGILIALDILPPEIEEPLTALALTVGPVLIGTFRTWYTDKSGKQ